MEYEIGDEPQGLPDRTEADRDGGLRERLIFRKGSTSRTAPQLDEEAPATQHGELV